MGTGGRVDSVLAIFCYILPSFYHILLGFYYILPTGKWNIAEVGMMETSGRMQGVIEWPYNSK